MEKCQYHDELSKDVIQIKESVLLQKKDLEYIRRDLEAVVSKFSTHVVDAEKEGGRHERLAKAESDIQQIKIDMRNDRIVGRWFMVGSGVISGMVVSGGIKVITTVIGIIK